MVNNSLIGLNSKTEIDWKNETSWNSMIIIINKIKNYLIQIK
jgi:hypothetical protein